MDKRFFPRIFTHCTVNIEVKDERGKVVFKSPGEIIDLSEDGISVITNKKLPDTKNVFTEITLPPGAMISTQKPVVLTNHGSIVWGPISSKSNKFRYGIFCMPSSDKKYELAIRKLLANSGEGYFLYEIVVFLKDTNIFGNTYFARHFDWQGMTREAYLRSFPKFQQIVADRIKLITKRASTEFINESTAFDEIIVKLQVTNIKKCSHDLIFTFINKNTRKIISRGEETITYANSKGKIIRIPTEILEVIKCHCVKRKAEEEK